MIEDSFQLRQTRAGWFACLWLGFIATGFAFFRARDVWPLVLVISLVNIAFYEWFVRRPVRRGVRTTRDFLLLVNNRALSAALLILTLVTCGISVAQAQATIGLYQLGGLVLLGTACALAGVRYAARQWRTRADLEQSARESTALGMAFRSKYPAYLFVAIAIVWGAFSWFLGENVIAALIASLGTASASHLIGYLIKKQLIMRRLLPAGYAELRDT